MKTTTTPILSNQQHEHEHLHAQKRAQTASVTDLRNAIYAARAYAQILVDVVRSRSSVACRPARAAALEELRQQRIACRIATRALRIKAQAATSELQPA